MPSLDSPIITLGALWFAGNRSPEYTGGETGMNLVAGGFGAASADFVVDEARNALNVDSSTVSDELARAVLGGVVSEWGGMLPRNNAVARGIHYDVARTAVTDAGFSLDQLASGGGFLGGGGNGGSSTPAAPKPTQQAPASPNMGTGGSESVVY